ncbi:MAG: VCBS repeat-containing protein [Dermatophilaceae bacterium]
MWWERYQEFSVGAIGTGITVGDYDQDGRPDLFVVSETGLLPGCVGIWADGNLPMPRTAPGSPTRGRTLPVWKQGASSMSAWPS